MTKPNRKSAGYIDKAKWEQIKREGPGAIERWINSQMRYTSVTVVLIGTETFRRKWVKFEIRRTLKLKHGLIGIYIHRLKNVHGNKSVKGPNPFDQFIVTVGSRVKKLSGIIKTYDWILDNGYENLGAWIEKAAKQAGM